MLINSVHRISVRRGLAAMAAPWPPPRWPCQLRHWATPLARTRHRRQRSAPPDPHRPAPAADTTTAGPVPVGTVAAGVAATVAAGATAAGADTAASAGTANP
ncbi:hypothetical protein R2360_18190 [Mycobacteroides chelonae]|nr:hypothetical protein [Mycobacteroides chelonae]MEC4845615.1 hypothetical protein [Mycobacteroides chelonae]